MIHTLVTTIIGVPIDCSGRAIGVERMPAALRAAGLARRLGLPDEGDLPVTLDDPRRDPVTGMIGFEAVCAASAGIRAGVGALLARGERPLVVGGCCTLLLGVFAALRDYFGRTGLAFVDGHLDFYDGQTSPTGEPADMELAILTGLGPAGLVDLAGSPPLVDPSDVFVLGYRDAEQAAQDGAPDPKVVTPEIHLFEAQAVRQAPASIGGQVAEKLAAAPGRYWLHLDLDILDETALPAVDYLMPGGLDWAELAALVRPLAQSPAMLGLDVTIYNPTLDPDGKYARQIVELLETILRT
ncbi:MAG: arginase family protein [Anaerolineae bacterium]|nr:arginase family protein [Anaerolineales bacterium]MCQ3976368.1 arginase family protein [Anaerolineae bacterium]